MERYKRGGDGFDKTDLSSHISERKQKLCLHASNFITFLWDICGLS